MKVPAPIHALSLAAAFTAGLLTHLLYQRWNPAISEFKQGATHEEFQHQQPANELATFRVTFTPPAADIEPQREVPVLQAFDVEKIRQMAGKPARIRGRVFRVGHSSRSNTYFLDFGPSQSALTAVIFASAVDAFEKNKLPPKGFNGKEVEVRGEIKDHPQYGLEVILEDPSQIKILK